MNNLTEYNWWGENNAPPEQLKTKKQLSALGLKPVNPVGYIETRKYTVYLYDPNNSDSVRPKRKASEKQLKALAKGRETARYNREFQDWDGYSGQWLRDKNEIIEFYQTVLDNKEKYLILDTETTGLSDAEIIEITIINLEGEVLLNIRIKPTISIPQDAIAIHGITDKMVTDSPSFSKIYPQIKEIIANKILLIYNEEFDRKNLNFNCKLHGLSPLVKKKQTRCVMEDFAIYYGEFGYGSRAYDLEYTWQPLEGNHTALGDCLAVKKLIEEIANDEIIEDLEKYFKEKVFNKK